jgi:hypothetical protein
MTLIVSKNPFRLLNGMEQYIPKMKHSIKLLLSNWN